MTVALDSKKVAKRNPMVDFQKLEKVQRVRELREAAGIQMKANYRLAPVLKRGKNLVTHKVVRLWR